MMRKRKHLGSYFDSFLRDEGILEEVETAAIKRVLSVQIENAMREKKITRAQMAILMGTSRSALGRLLDPDNSSITLQTISKAAAVVGKRVRIELV